jgi:hypothetical protein
MHVIGTAHRRHNEKAEPDEAGEQSEQVRRAVSSRLLGQTVSIFNLTANDTSFCVGLNDAHHNLVTVFRRRIFPE